MEYLIALLILLMPILIGYIYGKDDVDPNTEEGKIYYSKDEV